MHTKAVADKYLALLKEKLTEKEYQELSIAYNHHTLGEGREELDEVCARLKKIYTEEKPLLKFTASVKPRRSKPIPPEVWKKQYKADEQKKEDKN